MSGCIRTRFGESNNAFRRRHHAAALKTPASERLIGFPSAPMSAIDVLTLADLIVLDVHQIGLRAERSACDAPSRCFDAYCPSAIFSWDRKRDTDVTR